MCALPCFQALQCWHRSISPGPFLRTDCMLGKDCAPLLGCPGMLLGAVLAQPRSVCASPASVISGRPNSRAGEGSRAGVPGAFPHIPQAS